MRTLALLAALLLLAFQAQAQTLQDMADQVSGPDQPGDEDQDVAISFTGEEHLTRKAAGHIHCHPEPHAAQGLQVGHPWYGLPRIRCQCRRTTFCNFFERNGGNCKISGRGYKLCCH